MLTTQFSPHTRGCSAAAAAASRAGAVFPAYAGMFLRLGSGTVCRTSFPRIRGDVPIIIFATPSIAAFSPHTRGCSAKVRALLAKFEVFPAYAGMFRILGVVSVKSVSFPRIRGDVPHPGRR